ncbi:hypothetical protein [Candidatus Chlorohelix sp.]|uniref:hypothetical protein n=1 Tax=Candidatus Chlorohelix sp. TaxID=3139201 RepID=UPI0030461F39
MQETKKISPGIILGLLAILIFNIGVNAPVRVQDTSTAVVEVQTSSGDSLGQPRLFRPLKDFKWNASDNTVSQPMINLPGTNASLGISEGARVQDREK